MKIYLDMDGTIADLYMVPDWLEGLQSYDPRPYRIAEPMMEMELLNELIGKLQSRGHEVGIVSWLSKCSTKDYDKEVRKAKREWLKDNLPNCKNIHIVKYGTKKSSVVPCQNSILFDDEIQNRKDWTRKGGIALNPQEVSIVKILEMIASI